MAAISKILGQIKPAGTTDTDVYTVPANTQAQVILNICNQTGSAETYRVALRQNGAGLSAIQYLVYDVSLAANTFAQIKGLCLNAGDVITARSASGNISFTATGLEIT